MAATPRSKPSHWAWGSQQKWWLYQSASGSWYVRPPLKNGYRLGTFDSWSSAMAFILATDTRKAASS